MLYILQAVAAIIWNSSDSFLSLTMIDQSKFMIQTPPRLILQNYTWQFINTDNVTSKSLHTLTCSII